MSKEMDPESAFCWLSHGLAKHLRRALCFKMAASSNSRGLTTFERWQKALTQRRSFKMMHKPESNILLPHSDGLMNIQLPKKVLSSNDHSVRLASYWNSECSILGVAFSTKTKIKGISFYIKTVWTSFMHQRKIQLFLTSEFWLYLGRQ